ncbi:uncharacterized protein BDV14DRAFT_45313 [Aspergillus stella-maris]|uniref:uncharacterized protein n=1 Tax=Aspergillus stella-maris TaxID=1810926 RepID=UPI003CCD6FEA
MANEMETFAARLATFDLVLHPDRRSSTSKSGKPISWPHSRPSPAELAHAGFFYNPYETNPDNATCFLCRRALDGWEEDDNPITEHLKHAKDCGWAVMMDIQQRSSNPAEIEDPTSEAIVQARLSTFGDSWPHDGKKGWVCQSDKMVEGGWYFCPNEESADLASCAYCKLSLDGWEPKDNPFDEHYRRSSDCSFFVFAKPAKGKGSRSKKSRTSKASRQSTQSTASDFPASDVEDMDQSMMSQPAKSKSTKKTKAKSKTTKAKKDEPQEIVSEMDLDETEYAQPEPPKAKRSTRGRKRSSAAMEEMSIADEDAGEKAEPPTKKRASKRATSRTRAQSILSTDGAADVQEYDSEAVDDDANRRGRATTKKASRARKTSRAASTTRTTKKSRVPRDSELDAAIEAGLEGDEPQNMEPEEVEVEKPVPKATTKKPKSKKKNAKKEAEPVEDAVDRAADDEVQMVNEPEADQQMVDDVEVPEKQEPEPAINSKRRSRNKSEQLEKEEVAPAPEPLEPQEDQDDHRQHESFVSVEIVSKPPASHPEVESHEKESKISKKKASSEKPKKSQKADKAEKAEKAEKPERKRASRRSEVQETPEKLSPPVSKSRTPEITEQKQPHDEPSRRRSSKVPPKTAERYSDIPQEKQYARSIASDSSPEDTGHPQKQDEEDEPVSPLPSASRGTPSLSPQSSDAENHPPSMKASAQRPQLTSPTKNASVRFPLAASTPSPSKRNASAGTLKTSHPWVPINIDEILMAGASDKENVGALGNLKGELTSPEKKMTVEEWIMWNAKNGEERLKRECERLVGQFEREGARAMRALEGIECVD